jgi:hypothetical protein
MFRLDKTDLIFNGVAERGMGQVVKKTDESYDRPPLLDKGRKVEGIEVPVAAFSPNP